MSSGSPAAGPTASGRVRVSVPATSANLGPGFDALGLALALRNEVSIEARPRGLEVVVDGEGAGVDEGPENLVVRSAQAAFDRLGNVPDGLRFACRNAIPYGRGLGSSAAAIVGGVTAAYALACGAAAVDRPWILALAAEIEGHADNVAAAVLGGLTVAWTSPDGVASATRLEPAAGLRPMLLLPQVQQSTQRARAALPESVPHSDAAHAAGRAALLVAALTGRRELLLAATEDKLHQPYRSTVMPAAVGLLIRLRASGLAAVLSGAGPAILVLDAVEGDAADGSPPGWVSLVPAGWQLRRIDVDRDGVRVQV